MDIGQVLCVRYMLKLVFMEVKRHWHACLLFRFDSVLNAHEMMRVVLSKKMVIVLYR